MRVCVIGAGAMGCLYGVALAEAGADVALLDNWKEHAEAMRRNGVRLSGVMGERTVRLPVASTASDLEPGFDVAVVLTDTNATREAAATAAALLAPDGWAITLQNGIGNVEALQSALGEGRVVGGNSYHSAAMRGPGHAEHTNVGVTLVGEVDGRTSDRVTAFAGLLAKAGHAAPVVGNVMSVIWTKFVHNCAINPIAAVSGLRVGEIARNPSADTLQTRILDEIMAVVAAKGVTLTDDDPVAKIKAFCRLKYNRPSMQQHMEAGKRTEIDSLNGAIVREGATLGIPTPYNEALVCLVKAREETEMRRASGEVRDYAALEAAAKAEG